MPRWSASLRSPVFHLPPLMNWTTPTLQPRAQPRPITPKAAEDFPFPCPVLRRTIDWARATLRQYLPLAINELAYVVLRAGMRFHYSIAFHRYIATEIA